METECGRNENEEMGWKQGGIIVLINNNGGIRYMHADSTMGRRWDDDGEKRKRKKNNRVCECECG